MNDLREFRLKLGLTQAEMSGLLGLGDGQLSMVESGKRVLPLDAQLTLGKLETLIHPMVESEIECEVDVRLKAILAKQIRLKERELRGYQLKLEKLEEKLHGLLLLQTLAAIPEMDTLWPEKSEQDDHWQLIQRKANKKKSSLISEILHFKICIAGLEKEIETCRTERLKFFFVSSK